jgi:FkbM family methyltransferase
MWTKHDLLTLNEVFFRHDYDVQGNENVIVDFGSNIGISGLYFITHAPKSHIFLFEPVPFNVQRLKEQLAGFETRFTLSEGAVGTLQGFVDFGVEESGRYGGIGKLHRSTINVPCHTANSVLDAILQSRPMIDLLKVDIEGSEQAVIRGIHPELARRVRVIYAEAKFHDNPLAKTHTWRQAGNLAKFTLRTQVE